MDFDLFLTSPRWEILQIIAGKPSSPVEIAEKLNTTVSYVSQQIKLLDAANLLKKEKTGEVLKGKPRSLFSLSNELLYLTILSKKTSEKKLIQLTDHHKTILNIWLLKDPSLHYYFEKFYWKLEEDIEEIEGIFIENSGIIPRLLIVTESKKIKPKIEGYIHKLKREIEYIIISRPQLKRFNTDFLLTIHDPNNIFEELKGGIEKKDG